MKYLDDEILNLISGKVVIEVEGEKKEYSLYS